MHSEPVASVQSGRMPRAQVRQRPVEDVFLGLRPLNPPFPPRRTSRTGVGTADRGRFTAKLPSAPGGGGGREVKRAIKLIWTDLEALNVLYMPCGCATWR